MIILNYLVAEKIPPDGMIDLILSVRAIKAHFNVKFGYHLPDFT